jgi:cobalt-zinc-cadmium efflux system membrane fusion protein
MQKAVFFLSLYILIMGCGQKADSSRADSKPERTDADLLTLSQDQIKMMGIEVGSAPVKMIASTFPANGIVAVLPQNRAAVSAKLAGRIEAVQVHEGQNVRKGQILFRIATTVLIDIQQAYLHAKADLLYLEKELERQRSLQNSSAGAAKNLEDVQAKYWRAKADLEGNAAKLQYLSIDTNQFQDPEKLKMSPYFEVVAPIAGNVTEIPVSIGQVITEGSLLCHIINAGEHLHAHVEVFAQNAAYIQEGQTVIIRFPGGQHPDMRSAVEYVSRELNAETKTISLHVPLPDGKGIVPGMSLTAIIQQKGALTPALPDAALLQDAQSVTCFVVEKDDATGVTFRKTTLKTQGNTEGFWGFSNSFPENTRFVLKGAAILEGAMKKDQMQE